MRQFMPIDQTAYGQAQAPDDTEPTLERQQELEEAFVRNKENASPPYANVLIRSRGELTWILRRRCWSGEQFSSDARADLRRSLLRGVNLSGLALAEADFSSAQMRDVNLQGAGLRSAVLVNADLLGANLSGAYFAFADMQRTRLDRANLQGTMLGEANLQGASLDGAKINDANFTKANLKGANLRAVQVDGNTTLSEVVLDEATQLGNINWSGVPLARVDWSQIKVLGDEANIGRITGPRKRAQRVEAYRDAARAYHGLSVALRGQGISIPSSEYRLRSLRLERKALLASGKLLAWLFSLILDVVAGYGERPGKTLVSYAAVILAFAVGFYATARLTCVVLTPLDSALLSFSSFHGRGLGPPGEDDLGSAFRVVAGLEAVAGLFIEAIFIAAFGRRFLQS